ncbi:PREDICTED: nuclear receptor-interacting protein 3 [Chrysochloris asiatica]|uniref:Nuclear receptor-interacting protein 3 n=1 Tax=Chrysochloris asiatica TaxID=185453 RepID=A0A9B0WZS2_CHRAS|nr:PREDICTED: nuclear receptor-interacting protein 3 [Chrysochloris asiatica]
MAQLSVIPGSATAWTGLLTEGGRKETDMREAASLRQQRRMKQAVQFIHKDSADLLPLDGLKKLGSSKDTQPHNILQRRLMETNLSKLRSSRVPWASKTNRLNQAKSESLKKSEDDDMILVSCQCAGKDVKALVDTGCQHNLISSACVDRLGLKEYVRSHKHEGEKLSLPRHLKVVGQIEHLVITLGSLRLDCPAAVVEDSEKTLSLGLQTLRSLKCIINLDKHRLIMGKTDKEEIPFVETVSLNEDKRFQWEILCRLQSTDAPQEDQSASPQLRLWWQPRIDPASPGRSVTTLQLLASWAKEAVLLELCFRQLHTFRSLAWPSPAAVDRQFLQQLPAGGESQAEITPTKAAVRDCFKLESRRGVMSRRRFGCRLVLAVPETILDPMIAVGFAEETPWPVPGPALFQYAPCQRRPGWTTLPAVPGN